MNEESFIQWRGIKVNWIYPVPNNMNLREQYMCNICSALVGKDSRRAHETFHETYTNNTEVKIMSSAAWCDPGNHAFKAGEKGSQHFSGTFVDDDGIVRSQEMDACAQHSFQTQPKTPQAIDRPPTPPSTVQDVAP